MSQTIHCIMRLVNRLSVTLIICSRSFVRIWRKNALLVKVTFLRDYKVNEDAAGNDKAQVETLITQSSLVRNPDVETVPVWNDGTTWPGRYIASSSQSLVMGQMLLLRHEFWECSPSKHSAEQRLYYLTLYVNMKLVLPYFCNIFAPWIFHQKGF